MVKAAGGLVWPGWRDCSGYGEARELYRSAGLHGCRSSAWRPVLSSLSVDGVWAKTVVEKAPSFDLTLVLFTDHYFPTLPGWNSSLQTSWILQKGAYSSDPTTVWQLCSMKCWLHKSSALRDSWKKWSWIHKGTADVQPESSVCFLENIIND